MPTAISAHFEAVFCAVQDLAKKSPRKVISTVSLRSPRNKFSRRHRDGAICQERIRYRLSRSINMRNAVVHFAGELVLMFALQLRRPPLRLRHVALPIMALLCLRRCWGPTIHCKIALRLILSSVVWGFAPRGKALARPCLGVAVLKTELRICGEAGFAKHCGAHSLRSQFGLRSLSSDRPAHPLLAHCSPLTYIHSVRHDSPTLSTHSMVSAEVPPRLASRANRWCITLLFYALLPPSVTPAETKFAQFQNKDRWSYKDEEQVRQREGGVLG